MSGKGHVLFLYMVIVKPSRGDFYTGVVCEVSVGVLRPVTRRVDVFWAEV